jgi:hypothetical protein
MKASFPLMFFVSRTPTIEGQTHCRMSRFLGFHAGPHQTGWRRKAQSIPLATGSAVHTGVELLARWVQDYQRAHHGQPPQDVTKHLDVIAWAATEAAARYEHAARARGFLERGLEGIGEAQDDDQPQNNLTGQTAVIAPPALPAPVETLILEQRTLIEAQVWVFAALLLPQILGQYRILDVEHEESMVLDCTCGLGDGVADWTIHHDRDCEGICQMGRADLLLEGWEQDVRGQICYDEIKTKATPNLPWEKSWEHSGQLRINMETASRRLGKRVEAAYIPVLFKGWRGRDRNDPPEAPKTQHTPLVYGYYDPGSPGFRAPDWKAAYKWTDDYGKGHSLPKTYQSQAIWDESIPLPEKTHRYGASRVETWVMQYLTPQQWPALAKLLGPFPHQVAMIPDTIKSVLAEERLWRSDVAQIRQAVKEGTSEHEAAAELISRSWQCLSFSGEPCAFQPLCFHAPGWEDPGSMGLYTIRTPHHLTEKRAAEASGLVFPIEEGADDDEPETTD